MRLVLGPVAYGSTCGGEARHLNGPRTFQRAEYAVPEFDTRRDRFACRLLGLAQLARVAGAQLVEHAQRQRAVVVLVEMDVR